MTGISEDNLATNVGLQVNNACSNDLR